VRSSVITGAARCGKGGEGVCEGLWRRVCELFRYKGERDQGVELGRGREEGKKREKRKHKEEDRRGMTRITAQDMEEDAAQDTEDDDAKPLEEAVILGLAEDSGDESEAE
jgi:hypothetical protein